MPKAYSWPNDPQVYGGDTPAYRVIFAPGGTTETITDTSTIPFWTIKAYCRRTYMTIIKIGLTAGTLSDTERCSPLPTQSLLRGLVISIPRARATKVSYADGGRRPKSSRKVLGGISMPEAKACNCLWYQAS